VTPPSLSLVADALPKPETVGQHVRRLQAEARALAKDHVAAFMAQLASTQAAAQEIVDGGDAYPAGLRMVARDITIVAGDRLQTADAIMSKMR
jgi:hypothetical protein